MDLRANDLTGPIPSELGHLSKLGEIPVVEHRINFVHPCSYCTQRHFIGSLQIHANELTGTMPQEVCQLRSDKLNMLVADCRSEVDFDEVTCDEPKCCTRCY